MGVKKVYVEFVYGDGGWWVTINSYYTKMLKTKVLKVIIQLNLKKHYNITT